MAVKSVIDVEVNDEAFKVFHSLFEKYKAQAAEMPGVWADVGKETKDVAGNFGDMVAAMMAQATLQQTMEKRRKDAENRRKSDEARKNRYWKGLVKGSKEVAGNVKTATTFLAKWVPIATAVGGLLGVGSLFGLSNLAGGVLATRRTALGRGTTYGEAKAFDTNFGRFVDPNGFLSGVNESLHDVSKRYSLYAAGLSERDVSGKDTATVSAALLGKLKGLADKTPDGQLQQLIASRGLGQFVSLEDMVRLKATPRGELDALTKSYASDRKGLDLDPRTQLKWANFSTQLTRAGNKIETTFVNGLTPLAPALSKLSDSFAKAVDTFLSSPKLKEWLDSVGTGLEDLAKYMTSDEFQKDVKAFASDVGTLAKALADALHALGKHSIQDAAFGAAAGFVMGGPGGAVVGGLVGGGVGKLRDGREYTPEEYKKSPFYNDRKLSWDPASWFSPNSGLGKGVRWLEGERPNSSNPGNIRGAGGKGFREFSTPEDGVRAVAAQLLRYQFAKKWGNKDTIAKIVSTYAPASDGNDVDSYIKDVSKQTGFGANDHLDLSNKDSLAKLTAAILRHENVKKNSGYTPKVVLKIINSTGSNVTASAAAVAK